MGISELRNEYGSGYVSVINDLTIPWKPLTIGEFIHYEDCLKQEQIVETILEDEIFKKCVLDGQLVKRADYLPAGTITTVAQNILQASGPQGLDEFNNALEEQRNIASSPLHNLATMLVSAFPAYKLEDIYAMSYETFLLRLAQAEPILLRMQIISEPIKLMTPEELEKKNKRGKKRGPAPDLKAAWEKQSGKRSEPVPSPPAQQPIVKPIPKEAIKPHPVKPGESPIFDKNGKPIRVKGLDIERIQIENSAGSEEERALRASMVESSKVIYKDTLAKLSAQKKK